MKESYLTGGEPFLHPEIRGILTDLLTLAPTTVLTNGTLIDSELAQEMCKLNKSSSHPLNLRVSLESYREEENNWLRGKGSFSQALVGDSELGKCGFCSHPDDYSLVGGRTGRGNAKRLCRADPYPFSVRVAFEDTASDSIGTGGRAMSALPA